MKKIVFALLLIFISHLSNAQNLYLRTFGGAKSNAIIFLHGGPGYNCATFEATTAKRLADSGYFVIVYDRRGEGRSYDKDAYYTFRQTFDDINKIYKIFNLKQASFIGHSFGGVVATLYAEKYPEKINAIILAGAPVSLQRSFKTIIKTCKEKYAAKNDSVNLSYMSMLEKMDTASLLYSSYCFSHAMNNGFYSPKKRTTEATAIYSTFGKDTLIRYASQMTADAPAGFWKNEKYTTLDLTSSIKKLVQQKVKIFGIYGKEDGLYSPEQVAELGDMIGTNNISHLENCSHSSFIDQQTIFIESIQKWVQ